MPPPLLLKEIAVKFEILHQTHYMCDMLVPPGSIVEPDGWTPPEDEKTGRRPEKVSWTVRGKHDKQVLWTSGPSTNMEPRDDEAKKAWRARFGDGIPGNIPSPVETLNMKGGEGARPA
jgi:hypothetical protein